MQAILLRLVISMRHGAINRQLATAVDTKDRFYQDVYIQRN